MAKASFWEKSYLLSKLLFKTLDMKMPKLRISS